MAIPKLDELTYLSDRMLTDLKSKHSKLELEYVELEEQQLENTQIGCLLVRTIHDIGRQLTKLEEIIQYLAEDVKSTDMGKLADANNEIKKVKNRTDLLINVYNSERDYMKSTEYLKELEEIEKNKEKQESKLDQESTKTDADGKVIKRNIRAKILSRLITSK